MARERTAAGGGEAGHPPAPLVHEITRPMLLARLDAAVRGTLTFVVAPAGWGKTVTLAQWARKHEPAVRWFDAAVDAPTEIVAAVADAIAVDGGERFVVVDSAARLPAPELDALGALIEQAPPDVHVVLAARYGGLFPGVVARLRIRDDAAFLYTPELAFDRDISSRVLAELSAQPVPAGVVETLMQKTAGWPAAIALAGVAMRERGKPEDVAASFGGHDPQLRAFVREDVLAVLEPTLRSAVLRAAVPDAITASLCAELTGRDDGDDLLDRIANYELFDERPTAPGVREFSPLLRDALRHEVRANDRSTEARLLEIAAGWHVRQGTVDDIERAGDYLVRAEAWDAVCAHATEYVRLLHANGRVHVVGDWLARVPLPLIRTRPELVTLCAAALTLQGETLAAEAALAHLGDPATLPPPLRLASLTIRSVWGIGHVSPRETLTTIDKVVDLLDTVSEEEFVSVGGLLTPAGARTIAHVMRARSEWYLGSTTRALESLRDVPEDGGALALPRLHLYGTLAEIHASNGSLIEAERHSMLAARVAHTALVVDHPLVVAAELAHAHLLTERGDYVRAGHALDHADRLMRWGTFTVWYTRHAVERAWLAYALGAPGRALEIINAHLLAADPPPLLMARCRTIAARCVLEIEGAATAATRLAYRAHEPFAEVAGTAIQLAVEQQDLPAARRILEAWPSREAQQDDLSYRLWSAVLLQAEGNASEAWHAADEVAELGGPEGHVRLFLDGGLAVRRLLHAVARHRPGGYAAHLLAPPTRPIESESTVHDAVSLSPRERSVLQHLANRLTYSEIADAMFISRNTVKTHTKSVYTKLGAAGRTEALERAHEIGLL